MAVGTSEKIRAGVKVTIVGMIANLVLVILKIYFGFIGRSQALVADGVHSLSDLFSDGVVILGLKWGNKEADEDHPFGHGRIETLSALIIGLLLIAVGVGMVYHAAQSLYDHDKSIPSLTTLLIAFISVLIKEALYQYTIRVGRKIKSYALIGNAWHHRSDALSSIAVLVGVGAAYLNPDWVLADVLAALFVTYFVIKVGGQLIWSSLKEFTDTAPKKEVIETIEKIAEAVDGVDDAHDIRARYSASQILAEVHIVVNPDISVRQGHAIAKKVEADLIDQVDDLVKVIIHVDPE